MEIHIQASLSSRSLSESEISASDNTDAADRESGNFGYESALLNFCFVNVDLCFVFALDFVSRSLTIDCSCLGARIIGGDAKLERPVAMRSLIVGIVTMKRRLKFY